MHVLKTYWKWLILVAIVVVVFARVRFAAVAVDRHKVQAETVAAEVMGTGTLEARVKTTISPRIQERLAEVLVDQNDTVEAGQLLARLDDGELKRQVEMASAALAAAKATVDRVSADEVRARAVEEQARQEHARVSELALTAVSSQAALDKAVEQLRIAQSDLARAQAATTEARQQVNTAERTLDYHRERLTFAEIRSPYDGLVTRRDRDPGGVVLPGSSLLQLVSTNEIWVSAWVDETASAGLAPGQPARVVFRAEPGKVYQGEVARLSREADRETREFLVDVGLQQLPQNWTLGQRAEVFIVAARKENVVSVPMRFVQWRQGKPGVFVDQSGKAVWREVNLGLQGRDTVEVQSGLADGDQVVVMGTDRKRTLQAGTRLAEK